MASYCTWQTGAGRGDIRKPTTESVSQPCRGRLLAAEADGSCRPVADFGEWRLSGRLGIDFIYTDSRDDALDQLPEWRYPRWST